MSDQILRVLDEGGWGVYAVLLCALVTHPFSAAVLAVASVSKRKAFVRRLAQVALLLSLCAAFLGVVGYVTGLIAIAGALEGVDATSYATTLAYGLRMNTPNLTCGAVMTILPTMLSLLALNRAAQMPDGARSND